MLESQKLHNRKEFKCFEKNSQRWISLKMHVSLNSSSISLRLSKYVYKTREPLNRTTILFEITVQDSLRVMDFSCALSGKIYQIKLFAL